MGLGKIDFKKIAMKVTGITAGTYASSMLFKTVDDTTIKPGMKGMLLVVLGAVLPELVSTKNDLVDGIGSGMIAYGMQKVMTANGFVIGDVGEPSAREMYLEQALGEVSGTLDEVARALEIEGVGADGDYVAEVEEVGRDSDYVAQQEGMYNN